MPVMRLFNALRCSRFLVELESCADDPVEIARCFVKRAEGFVIYSDYCSNYPRYADNIYHIELVTVCF